MSNDNRTTGKTLLAGPRRKNNTPSFGDVNVSRADLGSFQDGVFQLSQSSPAVTNSAPPSRNRRNNNNNNKAMSKSADNNHTGNAKANIIQKPPRVAKTSSGKHLSFAPDSSLVQIHHFPATSPTSSSFLAEDYASSHAAAAAAAPPKQMAAHWAGGAYANSPDPTCIPLPMFAPKAPAVATFTPPPPVNSNAAQASLDLRRLLNIPAPQPLDATA